MAGKRSWEGLRLAATAVVLIGAGFWLTSRFVSPAPPRTIDFLAGPRGGAYAMFAEGYAKALERQGIELRVRHTSGSVENLALIRAGEADVALVQTGIADPARDESLLSLGSLFHEPLWLFVREGVAIERLNDLHGRRIDVGREGSGTRALSTRLLAMSEITPANSSWIEVDDSQTSAAIAAGTLDAIFTVGSVDSPRIRGLLAEPALRLHPIERAEAHTRIDHSLTRVLLPEGVVDFAGNVPPEDVELLSAMGEFVVAPQLHPALIDLLLQAAARVHGRGDLFSSPGEMPTPKWVDLPLSPDADRYYRYGPPFLQRYLPFWAATQIDRLKVMLIPVIALLLPLARIFPPTYRWRVRSRIYRWYRELRDAEPIPGETLDAEGIERRIEAVARIEREVAKLPTPPSYAAELYALRLHVGFVRQRLASLRESAEAQLVTDRAQRP